MSLLLEALRRSEGQSDAQTLAFNDPEPFPVLSAEPTPEFSAPLPPVAPIPETPPKPVIPLLSHRVESDLDSEPQASSAPVSFAAPFSSSTHDAQQAAQVLMQASAASGTPVKAVSMPLRRMWLLLILAVLTTGIGLGWLWWSGTTFTTTSFASGGRPAPAQPLAVVDPAEPLQPPSSPHIDPATPTEPRDPTTPLPLIQQTALAPVSAGTLPMSPPASVANTAVVNAMSRTQTMAPATQAAVESNAQTTLAPPAAAQTPVAKSAPPPTDARVQLVKSSVAEHVRQGWHQLQAGNWPVAEQHYRQALKDHEDEPDATLGLAVALHRQKKSDDAWTAYQRALQLWPDNPVAQTGMLAILTETDAHTALSRLQEWIGARPRDAAAHAALAQLWAKQGEWSQALPLFQKAMRLEPQQGTHLFNVAVAYDQLHRYPEAVAHYRMALQGGFSGLPQSVIEQRLMQLEQGLSP